MANKFNKTEENNLETRFFINEQDPQQGSQREPKGTKKTVATSI